MPLPRILLLTTGGTIAMTPGMDGGITPTLTACELVAAVPSLANLATLEVASFSNKPGASLTVQDLVQLAARIEDSFARGCLGAVVVQGTDTIEETAFALELLVHSPLPIVITGAMRGASAPGSDGPANLLAAIAVAASPAAVGTGTLVVLGDQVHSARYVQKTHTTQPSAFTSPSFGPLGGIAEGKLHLHARLLPLPQLPRLTTVHDAAVALVSISLGDDGRLLPALPHLGYRGAVIEAMGAGHIPSALAPVVGELIMRMPVVLSTRVTAGPVLHSSYSFPGSEMDLLARGAIHGGALSGPKACLLMRLLLAADVAVKDLPHEYARRSLSVV
ncbi:TPA: asparaginase [Salmonella enterica]|uniref:Asparaginase n=1 Tax=Salmonella enterica TaxID=28901 RepID=A0A744HE42_SALER|nr:asparaginase [Salmonella enterica]HAF4919993.1 asparaginase [Salmonella enterica]